MVEVDGLKMVKEFAEEMENMLGRKMKSVKVREISILQWCVILNSYKNKILYIFNYLI